MPHAPSIIALLFIPLFAWSDRDVGDGAEAGLSRTNAMILAVVLGGILGAVTLGPWFSLVGVMWAVFRSIGFANSSLDPSTPEAIAVCALRYAAWLVLTLLAVWGGGNWLHLAAFLCAAAAVPVALRIRFGQLAKKAIAANEPLKSDFEATIELASGAAFGAALAAFALFG